MIIEKIKASLVEDFRECYKWFSTWVFVSIPTLIALQENIPVIEQYVPQWVVAVLAILGLVARVIKQGKENKNGNPD